VLDPELQKQLRQYVVIQLNDNVKARLINHSEANNIYVRNKKRQIRSQVEIARLYSGKISSIRTITEYNFYSNGKQNKLNYILEK
jgi:polyphosphate kinase